MLEYFPYSNFSRKIAVSLDLWKSEQSHYEQLTAVKKRNFRLVWAFAVFSLLSLSILAILARPTWVFLIVIVAVVLSILFFSGIRIWQQQNLNQWRERNNRLFAQPLKEAIFKAFFDELQPNKNIKTTHQVIHKSLLYPAATTLQSIDFQYEGFFNNEPLLIYFGAYGQSLSKHNTAFFNLSKKVKNNIQHFLCLKNQNLEKNTDAEPQHFGYFSEMEAQFNFYSNQRGALAAFIEQNEQILQRINNLQLSYLLVSVLGDKINCSFDIKLFTFWQEIEISKPITNEDLQRYYNDMSKLVNLVSLAQNLQIPALENE